MAVPPFVRIRLCALQSVYATVRPIDRSQPQWSTRFSIGHCAAQVLREFRVTERVRKWTEEYVLRLNLCTRCRTAAQPALRLRIRIWLPSL